jgi:hypothetical protein
MKNKIKSLAFIATLLTSLALPSATSTLMPTLVPTAKAEGQRMFLCTAHNTSGLTFEFSCWNRTCGQVLVLQFCESNTRRDGDECIFDSCR